MKWLWKTIRPDRHPPGSLAEAIANGTKEEWRRRSMLRPGSLGRAILEMPSYASVSDEMDRTGSDYHQAFASCQSRLREALDAEWASSKAEGE